MKNLGFVLFGIVLTVLWFAVPLAGETGFMSLWNVHPVLGILISLVPTGFTVGWIIQAIKKW